MAASLSFPSVMLETLKQQIIRSVRFGSYPEPF